MTEIMHAAAYRPPEEILAALSGEARLLCLGGAASRRVLISEDFTEEPFAACASLVLGREPSDAPWAPNRVIVASYSDFSGDGGAASRAFHVHSGWVWDRERRELYAFAHDGVAAGPLPPATSWTAPPQAVRLMAAPDDYQELACRVIDDIKSGRFYQLNLLRFFQAHPPAPADLLHLWARRAGAMGFFLRTPELSIASFSPERLVSVTSDAEGLTAVAEPIKGTVVMDGDDPAERARARALLATARKERAELAIITDLLRNDLFGIAHRHGVKVVARGVPVSSAGVEHFKSVIEAACPRTLTFGALCRALLPGGSITGAPKREVMAAIREYEGRPRDFFMGSVFALDERAGTLDASILIRTLVRLGEGDWEYAAGSGLTVASDPVSEAAEILAKCRVVADT